MSPHCVWSKEFLEAGKRRLAGDTARAATTDEVKGLCRESTALKEVVAEQALEIRLLTKSMIADGRETLLPVYQKPADLLDVRSCQDVSHI